MNVPDASEAVVYGINRDPFEVAKSFGWITVLPNDHQLQIDIDREEDIVEFNCALDHLVNDTKLNVNDKQIHRSKSNKGYHITLTFTEPMGVWQRIALQFLLHSDPVREALNCKRVLLNDPFPIAFFELGYKEPLEMEDDAVCPDFL